MNIIIGEKSGFCAGVSFTIKKASELLEQYGSLYCLGEIVHNERVVKSLEDKGMITVNSIDEIPDGSKVIFRAHGEAKKVYDRAKEKNLEVFDLTCGKVKLIHTKIENNKDSFVLIVGKATHPETIGHYGYIDKGFIIETIEDIDKSFEEFVKSGKKKVYVVAQTTFNDNKFDKIVDEIDKKYKNIEVVEKTICSATRERQDEVIELSKKVDTMIIVGGKNSSNTKELYNLANSNCSNTLLVQDASDLDGVFFGEDDTIGIMAGASTPNEVIEEIIDYIKR